MKTLREKLIGSRAFYRSVLLLLIPMIIQQFITSFVSLLDNVMVGSLGTEAISAASIANQVMMVYNLAIFGGISGISIFGAQFFGKGDAEGMRHTFRFKLLFAVLWTAVALVVYLVFGKAFIEAFLRGSSDGGDLALTLRSGCGYLNIMLWGLPPFALVQAYAGTLRETGETRVPMFAGVCAIVANLIGNWILIFGHLGAPALGVEGAAIATVASRYLELVIVVAYSHRHTERYPFFLGAYKSLRIPGKLAGRITRTALPLLVNEILWALGMTFINQFYSSRGLNAVAALNITGTAWNLFCVIMFAMGSAVSIMVGQRLGAGKIDEARDVDRKLIFLTEVMYVTIGLLMILAAPLVPRLYGHRRLCPADPLLCPRNLFHDPFRRADGDHVLLRRGLHLGGDGAAGVRPDAVYRLAHRADLRLRPVYRYPEGSHRPAHAPVRFLGAERGERMIRPRFVFS